MCVSSKMIHLNIGKSKPVIGSNPHVYCWSVGQSVCCPIFHILRRTGSYTSKLQSEYWLFSVSWRVAKSGDWIGSLCLIGLSSENRQIHRYDTIMLNIDSLKQIIYTKQMYIITKQIYGDLEIDRDRLIKSCYRIGQIEIISNRQTASWQK